MKIIPRNPAVWICVTVLAGLLHNVSSQAQCRFLPHRKLAEVTYRFVADATPYGLTLHVTLETQTEPNGKLVLSVPGSYAGERTSAIQNLRAITPGATLSNGDDPGLKMLNAAPGHPVTVAYELVKDWNGPLVHPKQFHPVLLPEYFEFTGSNALVEPRFSSVDHGVTNFDWQKLPAGWVLATSFGASGSAEGVKGRCQSATGPWQDVGRGLYTAGDFRLHRFLIHGQPAVLAIRGRWNFTDEQAIGDLQQVIGAVRSFWHDDRFPYFLVTVKPYDQDSGSWDGSAYTHAFWMYMGRQDSIKSLLPTLAHETFHEWNPLRMGTMSGQADRETEWFHEGFTDYYGYLLLLRAGVLTPAHYIELLNGELRKFSSSTSAYVRGHVIALWLDGAIRQDSAGKHTLDDVMFDLVRDSAQPLDSARIYKTIAAYITPADQATLLRAVGEHGDLDVPAAAPSVGACWHPEPKEFPVYDLGFDLNGSKPDRKVTGVTESGPAYAAGLRNGQKLKGWSVVNEPDRLAKITVDTDGSSKVIEFYPKGKAVKVWQYHLLGESSCTQSPSSANSQ